MKEKIVVVVCFAVVVINVVLFLHHSNISYFQNKFQNRYSNSCNSINNRYGGFNDEIPKNAISFWHPYVYSKRVDLRILVLTMNRPKYLADLLESIKNLEMDEDELAVEIWIDRVKNRSLDEATMKVARSFSEGNSHTCIHVHSHSVGLYNQWISTYSSEHLKHGEDEMVLFLEDDQIISRFGYRWLKAVHKHFRDVPYFLGTSLRSLAADHPLKHRIPNNHSVFMHRIFSTHAFSPNLEIWNNFQKWFASHHNKKFFKPYVLDIKPTHWYKSFEKQGSSHTMWSMWMIYYTFIEQLFSVYVNPATFRQTKSSNSTNQVCLCNDRQAKGLHFSRNFNNTCQLLESWNDNFIKFPGDVLKIDWNGSLLDNL